MNRDYDFTLTFAVPTALEQEAMESALFEAGCDDAIFGLGQKGRVDRRLQSQLKDIA